MSDDSLMNVKITRRDFERKGNGALRIEKYSITIALNITFRADRGLTLLVDSLSLPTSPGEVHILICAVKFVTFAIEEQEYVIFKYSQNVA